MRNGFAGKSSRVITLWACALVKSSDSPGFVECIWEGAFGRRLSSVFVEWVSFDSIHLLFRVKVTLVLSIF